MLLAIWLLSIVGLLWWMDFTLREDLIVDIDPSSMGD
jgi:hypothetical protein